MYNTVKCPYCGYKDDKEYIISVDYAKLNSDDSSFVTYWSQNKDGSLKFKGCSPLEDLPEYQLIQINKQCKNIFKW